MSSNSLNFKGLQHGKSLEAQRFPSQCINIKNAKAKRDLRSNKARWRCLQVFLGILFMSNTIDSFSQTTAPKVQWRRFDWLTKNPTILGSSSSGQTFTRDESGSDWWYDIKNSYSNGTKNGFPKVAGDLPDGIVMSGYSNLPNYDNAEVGGCNVGNGPLDESLCKWVEIGEDNRTPQFYQTVAKISTDGTTMQWFNILPFRGNAYRVTQLQDGSYIVVGDSKSTRKFDGSPIGYNGNENDYFCNGVNYNSHLDLADDDNPYLNQTSINSSFMGISHILQNGTIDWTYNYGFYNFGDVEIKTGIAHDAWDVQQSLPSGDVIIVGMSDFKAAAIRINPNTGELLGKRYLQVPIPNPLDGVLDNNSIGKTLICFNDANGGEKFIVGVRADVTIPGSSSTECTRVYTAQFDVNFPLNPANALPENWYKWYFDLQTNHFDYDQQNINSIIYLKNSNQFVLGLMNNCGYCYAASSSGNGEITTVTISPTDGHWIQTYNCGVGGAFDFRAGLCNNVYPDDGGYALVCTKLQNHPARPIYNCVNGLGNTIDLGVDPPNCFDADTYIAAFDPSGILKWDNTYKDEADESAPEMPPGNYKKQECMYSIVQTPDGGYLAAGNQSNNFDDNYLIKLYPENCASAISNYDIQPNQLNGVLGFYENPAYVIKHPYGSFNIYSEIWNTSKKVKGTVVVPAGYELVITGPQTIISFDDSKQTGSPSKIIVLPGGKLSIENGATLTSNGNCVAGMWDGIEVWGNNMLPQDLQTVPLDLNRPNELMSTNQGFVEIKGGSIIKNAIMGISVQNPEKLSQGNDENAGGILHAEDAFFINNQHDVDISWYHSYNPATNQETNNKCYFKRCTFETNDLLANPAVEEEMICPDEPEEMYTEVHLHLWNVKGVSIEGCTFKTELPSIGGLKPNYSKGIEAFDASFNCTVSGTIRNSFSNLKYGILNGSYNGSCDPNQYNTLNAPMAKIDRSDFHNCMRGIELDGTILTSINRCNFDINYDYGYTFNSSYPYGDNNMPVYGVLANTPVGIYTNAALSYRIKDNNFTSLMNNQQSLIYGMVNTNTSAYLAGETGYNTYENLFVHQQFEASNLMLKTNCNTHTNNAFIEHYSWSVFDQLGIQGNCLSSPETNIFDNNTYGTTLKDIHLDFNASTFAYNSNPGYVPVYQNLGAGLTICQTNIGYATICPGNVYPGIMHHINDSYTKLLRDYTNLKKLIDQDDTETLLQYIEDNNLEVIKNMPDSSKHLLSDETLMAMIERLPPSDWSDFETILLNNSPLNPRLLQLINESNEIPNPIKQTISNAQSGQSVRSVIDAQLLNIEKEKGLALNELVAALIDTALVDSAMSILQKDGSIGAKMMGLALDPYAHYGFNYASALTRDFSLLQRLSNNPESVQQLKDYLSYYMHNLNTTANLEALAPLGIASLDNIANVTSINGIYASVALTAAKKATYGYNPKPIRLVNSYREAPPVLEEEKANLKTENVNFNFHMSPNPANNFVQLEFENELPSFIELTDLTGKILFSSTMQNNKLTIGLSEYANGFYFIKAINKTNVTIVQKLIIVK